MYVIVPLSMFENYAFFSYAYNNIIIMLHISSLPNPSITKKVCTRSVTHSARGYPGFCSIE